MSHIPSFTVPRCSVEPHTSVSVSAYLGPVGRIQRSKLVCQQKNADARSKDVELACQWNCWTPEDSNPARYTNTLWWTLAEPGPEIIGQHGTSRFTPRNWQRSHDFSLMNMYEHVWTCMNMWCSFSLQTVVEDIVVSPVHFGDVKKVCGQLIRMSLYCN